MILSLAVGGGSARAVTLVADGVGKAAIVVDKEAPAVTKFAAQELAGYLEKISGARLPIVEVGAEAAEELAAVHDQQATILVGESKFTEALGLSAEALEPDGFTILSRPEALIILGKDDPRVNPQAWRSLGSAGTLYGVYRFLEELGVRFYYPGEVGEVIPQQATIAVENLNIADAPYFALRLVQPPLNTPETNLWMRKLGCGATSYPQASCHSFGGWSKKYQETHPEYFALHGEKRISHICFSDPGAREQMIEDAKAWLAGHDADLYPYFTVMQNDGAPGPCRCPLCEPRLHPEQGWYGLQSDLVAQAAVEVAEAIQDDLPDRGIIIGAYNDYTVPPVEVEALPANVGVCIFKHRQLLYDQEARQRVYEVIEGWLALEPREVSFWEYYNFDCWGGAKWGGVPAVTTAFIAEDIRRLKQLSGASGIPLAGELVFCDGRLKEHFEDRLWWLGLDHYVTAKFLWNPDLNREAMLDEFYQQFFGPAAEPMKELYSRAEEVWVNGDHGGRNLYGAKEVASVQQLSAEGMLAFSPWDTLFTEDIVQELVGYLEEAEAAAADAPYRERVGLVRRGLDWTMAQAAAE